MAIRRNLHRATLLTAGLLFGTPPVTAQIAFNEVWISADTNVRIPRSDGSGNILADDRSTIIVFPDGTGNASAPNGLFELDGADVDAFHRSLRQTSLDTARIIDSVLVRPADVFYIAGTTPIVTFDSVAAGIPDGVNLDAVTADPDTGALKVSFDRRFLDPNLGFVLPGDLVSVAGGQLDAVAISGAQFEDSVNLDAAHQLDAEQYLISVDVDTRVPGGPGTFRVRDHDVILFTASPGSTTGSFEPIFSLADESHPSWLPADLDALWAEKAIQAGEIRIVGTFREVQESAAGTVFVQVERINGSEGPVGIFVDSIAGSATEDVDFTGDVAFTALWGDGENGIRTIPAVDIVDDAVQEPVEQFTVEISIFSGDATVVTPSRATVRILDDDGENLFNDGFES